MSTPAMPRPGAVVAYWSDNQLTFGVVAGEEKQRIRLIRRRGREERVKANRIVYEVDPPGAVPGDHVGDREQAGERVKAIEERVRLRTRDVEVPLVWEVAHEAGPGAPPAIRELAELALDSADGADQAAVVLALLEDGVHFVRKGDAWEPRPRQSVEDLSRERERVARREQETLWFFEALGAAVKGGSFTARGGEIERRHLDALEQLALHDAAAPESSRSLALRVLQASGLRYDRPHEGAFRLLRCVGRFGDDDENLQVHRFGLRTRFPGEVLDQARRAAELGFDAEGRIDLTGVRAVSIDGPSTREIDDLVSVESLEDGGFLLGVHIADPTPFLVPDDAVDLEARARGLTYYMPDLRLPMVPAPISERAASLVEGEDRPALSFRVTLGANGETAGYELVRSVVRSAGRLTYDEADRAIREGHGEHAAMLGTLAGVAALRRMVRTASGAVTIRSPEVDVHRHEDGRIELVRLPADSVSREIVSEAMILAGQLAASFCIASDLPAIYRRQAAPSGLPELPPGGVSDPVQVRRIRRLLRRAEVGLQPGAHASLGLEAYVQVTSPIRRYQDLVTHRQIVSRLRSEAPAYDSDALQRIAATTERAASEARRAERAAADYWLLRYLEGQSDRVLDAIVVETEPRPFIQLLDCLREQPMNALAGAPLGETVRVRVDRVNPRAGILVLRRVD